MVDDNFQDDGQPGPSDALTLPLIALGGFALYLCRTGAGASSQKWGQLLLGSVLLLFTIVDARCGQASLSYGFVKRADDPAVFWFMIVVGGAFGFLLLGHSLGALLGFWHFKS